MGKSPFLMGKSTINGHFQWDNPLFNGIIPPAAIPHLFLRRPRLSRPQAQELFRQQRAHIRLVTGEEQAAWV